MRRFSDIAGTVMRKNTPIIDFEIKRGDVVKCELLVNDGLPIEFRFPQPKERALALFLDDRVVPETRIGLQKELKKVGILYFDMDMILHYNCGFSIQDDFWVRFPDREQDFYELQRRLCKGVIIRK